MNLRESNYPGWWRLVGNRRLFFFCLLLFLVSAVISFWFFFPAEVLQRRVVQEIARQTGQQVKGENGSLVFPLGLEFDLQIFPEQPELAPLLVEELQLSPIWTSLFSGNPGFNLQGGLSGGVLTARVIPGGSLQLELEDVGIGALQQPEAPYRAQGKLSGELSAEQLATASTAAGEFFLRVKDVQLLGLDRFGLPAQLALGLLQLDGKFDQRRVSFEKVVMTEGVMEMSGGGTLLVGETPESTRLNLNIRLHPRQSTPDSLRELINLSGVKPTADGSYLLRIGGTLARPVIR